MIEKRDNLFLVGSIIALILWVKYAPLIPHEYFWLYLLGLAILLVPFFYLLSLKKQIYQWSWEAIFYLLLLTFTGIVSFSFSVMGIDPRRFFH